MNSNQISLLIFTCEGREHLLPTTLQSLNKTCNYPFEHTILAIDGQYSNETIKIVKPKFIVQNYNRRGYIQSILNALKLVETDFFFWLEDDWVFTQEIDLQYLLEELNINPDWVQIRLSKTAPLSSGEKKNSLTDRVYESIYGFSANPCLCRTNLVYQGFDALKHESRDPTLG
ncbi:MAG: glycosyltransferase, partial [Pseudanabaena sp.]